MKKLMTMVGAATVAFGLFAETADLIEASVDFANETAGEKYTFPEDPVWGEQLWYLEGEAEGTITEGNPNFLTLEADAPVYRTFAGVNLQTEPASMEQVDIAVDEVRDGIVIDQKVKFSAFDAETETLDVEEGAKIAVWVKADADDDTKGTLQITTAALDENAFEPTTTTVDTEIEVAVADWHQLKITTIKAADLDGDVVPGFVVELNGAAIAKGDGLWPEGWDEYLTAQAKELIAENKLFPSMVAYNAGEGADTLVGVAYKGTGAIESIDVTKVEPAPVDVLPTATVTKIDAEGYEVAVQFDAGNIGVGYDNWTAKFGLTSDVDIGAGEVMLGGNYGEYGWVDKDYTCSKDEEVSVLAAVGLDDNITVKEVFEDIVSFKCGVKNVALKNDATFSLRLVIVNPDNEAEVKEICKIENLEVKAKAQDWDVPAGSEDKPAQEVWETIPQALADVPAGKLSTWAKANGIKQDAVFTDDMVDAYALNCALEDLADAKKTAEEAIKITSITYDAENDKWVITTAAGEDGDAYGVNGELKLVEITDQIKGVDAENAKLWKMTIVPAAAAK